MASTKRRIEAKGDYSRKLEAKAGEAGIKPGMLCKINSAGAVVKHSTSGGALGDENLIALEDALQGSTNVGTAYTNGQIVFLAIALPGDEFNVLIADEQDVNVGDKIMAGGSGLFKKNSGGTKVVAIAVEDNDLTGSNTSDTLSQVRFV